MAPVVRVFGGAVLLAPPGDYGSYESQARARTETTYRSYRAAIDPGNLRGVEYHLHHMMPLRCGFALGIPGWLMAGPWNLEMITAEANRRIGAMAILTTTVIQRARQQLGLFMVVLTIVSAVIIALIVYTLTMEKLREIATLKLIGAPDRTIIGLIVQQALLMGVVGFVAGTTLVSAAKDWFPRRVVLEPIDLGILFSVVVVVCLLASALGVRVAVRVDPARALVG